MPAEPKKQLVTGRLYKIFLSSEVKWIELRWSSWGQKYPVH